MNPLLIAQLLAPLLAGRVQVPSAPTAEPEEQAAAGINPAVLLAMLQALQRPAEPASPPAEIKLPRSAAVIAGIVVIGFFLLLAAIAGLLVMDRERFGAALAVLCVGFGVLASKFGTVVDFLFGSSWGSRQKDARRAADGSGSSIMLPAPSGPTEPEKPPSEPAPKPEPQPTLSSDVGRSTDPSTANIRREVSGSEPASIRYNNPGAQYPSARAAAFGQLGYGIIGGGHKIARFPHPVNGAAANFDLLRRNYVGMTIGAAGAKWTGDNGFGIPGYDPNAILTAEMMDDPAQAIAVMKAMARREAGRESPLTDEQWRQAHAMFRAGSADAWLASAGSSSPTPDQQKPRVSGADIVALARKHIGEAYVNVLVPKNDPNWKGPWDCAEFASWLVYQVAGIIYGCTNDADDPAKADAYTGAWQADAKAKGKMVSVAEAAATPGALLLRYPPAPGEMGHIAVSDGQGGTIEAKGKAYGVVADKVSGWRWDTGVLIPGIDYTAGGAQPVAPPTKLYAIGQLNMDQAKVRDIQSALAAKGFSPGDIDGEYGQNTALAVVAFQQAHGFTPDGEVGPDTSAALGVTL